MQTEQNKGNVLARIPDLTGPSETGDPLAVSGGGRLMNQALSFRLLAMAAILMLGTAVLPFVVGRSHRDGTAADGARPPSPAVSADVAPLWSHPTAKEPAAAPVVVKASPEAEAAPCPAAIPISQPPVASVEPLMSPWPNPAAYATSPATEVRGEDLTTGANQPMAIRPSEYIGNNHDRIGSGVH